MSLLKVNGLTKRVTLFRYFHWFLSKSTLKLTIEKYSDKPTYAINSFEKRQFSQKQTLNLISLQRFSQFSHLIKAAVIVIVPQTNEMQHRTPEEYHDTAVHVNSSVAN